MNGALELAALGWPVLPARPGGKAPLTRRGVRDATTDPHQIRRWAGRWPDANVAIATGYPGPQVLDVDDLEAARPILARIDPLAAPTVATSRGRHVYFHGLERGTVALGYGELRGQGSYVVCPPSIHPDGREYVWLAAPRGPLPAVPAFITAETATAGCGEHQAPAELVPHHHRHPYLKDFAVRLVRAGVTDQARVFQHLRLEFELSCAPVPAPSAGALEGIARWATRTRIAERERRFPPTGNYARPQLRRITR